MKRITFTFFILGIIVGAVLQLCFFKNQINTYAATLKSIADSVVTENYIFIYRAGHFDGARAVKFLVDTDTVTAEKYQSLFESDSLSFRNIWITEKQSLD